MTRRELKRLKIKISSWLRDPIFIIGGIASFCIGIVLGLQLLSGGVQGSALMSKAPISLAPPPSPPSAPNASKDDIAAQTKSVTGIQEDIAAAAPISAPSTQTSTQNPHATMPITSKKGKFSTAASNAPAKRVYTSDESAATKICALEIQQKSSIADDGCEKIVDLPKKTAEPAHAAAPTSGTPDLKPEPAATGTTKGAGGSLAPPTKEEVCAMSEAEIKAKKKAEIKKVQATVGTKADGEWGPNSNTAFTKFCSNNSADAPQTITSNSGKKYTLIPGKQNEWKNPEGTIYIGEVRNGTMNGQGKYVFAYSDKTKNHTVAGTFRDGGIVKGKSSGERNGPFSYVGEFKHPVSDGKMIRHGNGELSIVDTQDGVNILMTGIFEDNKLISGVSTTRTQDVTLILDGILKDGQLISGVKKVVYSDRTRILHGKFQNGKLEGPGIFTLTTTSGGKFRADGIFKGGDLFHGIRINGPKNECVIQGNPETNEQVCDAQGFVSG